MSKSPVSVRSRSQCSRLNAAVAWRVTAGTGEMPFAWLSETHANGPEVGARPPGKGMRDEGSFKTTITARHRWYSMAARRPRRSGDRSTAPASSKASDCGAGRVRTTASAGNTVPLDVDAIHRDPSVRRAVSAVSEKTSKPWARCLAAAAIVGAPRQRQGTSLPESAVAGHHSVRAGPRRSRHQRSGKRPP